MQLRVEQPVPRLRRILEDLHVMFTADEGLVDAGVGPGQLIADHEGNGAPVGPAVGETHSLAHLQQAGVWIYGTAGDAERSIYECDFRGPVALVMGAEAGGLRRLTREACDFLFHLPMRGQVESLNVSVATGVCLYEIRRARAARS